MMSDLGSSRCTYKFEAPVAVNRFSQVMASMTPLDGNGEPVTNRDISFDIRQVVPGTQRVDIWCFIHAPRPIPFRTNLLTVN